MTVCISQIFYFLYNNKMTYFNFSDKWFSIRHILFDMFRRSLTFWYCVSVLCPCPLTAVLRFSRYLKNRSLNVALLLALVAYCIICVPFTLQIKFLNFLFFPWRVLLLFFIVCYLLFNIVMFRYLQSISIYKASYIADVLYLLHFKLNY
jgi:hypothetical protein